MKLGVRLDSAHGEFTYGPFNVADHDLADQFARYLTDEVGPATVITVTDDAVTWQNPVLELLSWRARMRDLAADEGTCDELVTYAGHRAQHGALCVAHTMRIPSRRAAHYESTLRQLAALSD